MRSAAIAFLEVRIPGLTLAVHLDKLHRWQDDMALNSCTMPFLAMPGICSLSMLCTNPCTVEERCNELRGVTRGKLQSLNTATRKERTPTINELRDVLASPVHFFVTSYVTTSRCAGHDHASPVRNGNLNRDDARRGVRVMKVAAATQDQH